MDEMEFYLDYRSTQINKLKKLMFDVNVVAKDIAAEVDVHRDKLNVIAN